MKHSTMVHIENDILVRSDGSEGTEYVPMTPDEIPDFLSQKILNMKIGELFWILDLDMYYQGILEILFYMGFKDVTEESPSLRKMGARTFKYIISDKGTAYAIYVKNNKKMFYIYNADNLLANIRPGEICTAWGNGCPTDIRDLVDSTHKGITQMHGFQEKRTPYTVSMVAAREWKKVEELYFCENLTNCKGYPAPNECEDNLAYYIRKSYVGGWNYDAGRDPKEYMYKPGCVYDINSSYPAVMFTKPIPWGEPEYFDGEIPENIKDDERYYYFVRVKMQFKLKRGHHFPYIRKRADFMYAMTDYLSESGAQYRDKKTGKVKITDTIIGKDGKKHEVYPEFIMTKTDYELVHRHYNIIKEEVIDGVYYRTTRSGFKIFIDKYYKMKLEAKRTGDKGRERIAKIILNGLAGTLAKREKRTNIIYDENMKETLVTAVNPSASYIHMASAILSYAREKVYEAACANYDNFLYADTDSIHILGDNPQGIKIHDTNLGSWKLERRFDNAYYYKRKSYVLEAEGQDHNDVHLVMAGLSNDYAMLIEDIISGMDPSQIIMKATFSETYGKGVRELAEGTSFNPYMLGVEPDVTDKLSWLINNIQGSPDPLMSLRYVKFPTGIEQVNGFEIGHGTVWRSLNCKELI